MQGSRAGLIGGLICTIALAAGLVVAGMLGGDGGQPAQAVAGASAAGAIEGLGDCIPVAAHDGTNAAGCVLASDQYAPPPEYDKLVRTHGGLPVYTDASAATQVGVFAGPLGFVPQALVGQIPALAACHGELERRAADPSAPLTPSCTDLLTADGYPSSMLSAASSGGVPAEAATD